MRDPWQAAAGEQSLPPMWVPQGHTPSSTDCPHQAEQGSFKSNWTMIQALWGLLLFSPPLLASKILNNLPASLSRLTPCIPVPLTKTLCESKTWITFSSVTQSCPTLRPHGLQHARLPCPSQKPRACSNSRLSSWWCHPTISSSAVPYSSCLQSFPASSALPDLPTKSRFSIIFPEDQWPNWARHSTLPALP